MKLKLMAIIGIMLIVSLPIYSSAALGTIFEITKASGDDDINGYLKDSGDTLDVRVHASIDDDSVITKEQVRFGGAGTSPMSSPGIPFGPDQCHTTAGGYYECSFSTSDLSYFDNPETLRIYLYKDADDDGVVYLAADEYKDVYFDELDPSIDSFDVPLIPVSSGDVTFGFEVSDKACNTCGDNKCSGIEKIELSVGNYGPTQIDDAYTNPDDCSYSASILIHLSDIINIGDAIFEEVTATLTVYDNIGNSVSQEKTFVIDTTIPVIEDLRIKVGDKIIDWISSSPIIAEVSVNVSGDNINPDSVIADLHELNIDAPVDYNKKDATCTPIDDYYRCVWYPIEVKLDSATTVSVTINASDMAGNTAKVTKSKTIDYDETGPVVTYIATNFEEEGISYIGKENNKIMVEITEEGTGLTKNLIYLDLSKLGSGPGLSNNVQADECVGGICYFYDKTATTTDGQKTIYVLEGSSDDLGNPVNTVDSKMNEEIIVDTTDPVYLTHSIENIGADSYQGTIKTGDFLQIEITVTETNMIADAYADFSSIVSGAENVLAEDCSGTLGQWTCTWETDSIDIPGEIDSVLKFYLIDAANNTLEKEIPIEVLGVIVPITAPDNWEHEVVCSPDKFDREITSLVQMRSYCHVSLTKQDSASDQETLDINLGTCVDKEDGGTPDFISSVGLMNNQRSSTEPYIKLTLLKDVAAPGQQIEMTCPLEIISRVGNSVISQEEIENVDIELFFYNNPLDEISNNIQDKIDDVDKNIGGGWEAIEQLEKVMLLGGKLCKTWGTLKKVVVALQGLSLLLEGTKEALRVYPPGYAAALAARTGTCKVKEMSNFVTNSAYEKFFNTFCNVINCKMGKAATGEGWGYWASTLGGGGGMFGPDSLGKIGGSLQYASGNQIRGGTGGLGIPGVTGKDPRDYMNVKNSLILSMVTLCVPGIIHNLHKMRQIQCQYGSCLLSIRDTESVPISLCEDQKDYLTCKFVVGELFKVFPLTAIFNYYSKIIRNALSDPLAIMGVVIGYLCMPLCVKETIAPNIACSLANIATTVGEAIEDLANIQRVWTVEETYCDIYEDMKKDIEREEDDDSTE